MNQKLKNALGIYTVGILEGRPREAVAAYTGDRYTQHSTGVPDGPEGFVEFFDDFLARNPERDIRIVRSFVDGSHVFLHAHQILNGGDVQWVTMDILDTDDDDKMIEHWDVIAAFNPANPSGRSSIDGPTEVTDHEHTDTNKALVRAAIEDLLMPGGDVSKIDDYIAEEYLQHNPEVGDGRDHFAAMLDSPERPLWYDEIVLLVGEGNFVATLCKATFDGQPYAQMDLFRLENGRIVEHWDAAEPVPDGPQPNSGKF